MAMNLKTIAMGAGKVALPVGAGVASAKVGGKLVRLLSTAADEWADDVADEEEREWKQAGLELGGGLALSGVGLGAWHALSKKRTRTVEGKNGDRKEKLPTKAQEAAPFVIGGVLVGSIGVPLGRRFFDWIDGKLDEWFSDAPSSPLPANPEPQKAGGRTYNLNDVRRRYQQLQRARDVGGYPRRAGGVESSTVGRAQLGGAVTPARPGGVMAGRAGNAQLGGAVTPARPGGTIVQDTYGPRVGGTITPVAPRTR